MVKDGDGAHILIVKQPDDESKKKEQFTVTDAWQTLSKQNRYLNTLHIVNVIIMHVNAR